MSARPTRQVNRWHLPGGAAFWLIGYAFAIMLLGGSIPTPLYVVYQGLWGFSEGTLTVVYAVYVAGILAALLLTGHLSDEIGRRPVLLGAIALASAGSLVFALAQGVAWLVAARALQGLAIGAFTGAATATLIETQPHGDTRQASLVGTAAIPSGFALGALLSGLLVQHAPWPTVLVYLVYLVLFVPALIGIWAMPETVAGSSASKASLRVQRLGIPSEIRPPFFLATAAAFCAFAAVGLLAALAPSVVIRLLRVDSLAAGGLVVTAAYGTSAVAQLASSRLPDRSAVVAGLILLSGGLALVVASTSTGLLAVLLAGAVAIGAGHGLSFKSSLAALNRLAPVSRRGEVVSAYYVGAYVGTAVPVLGVGFAATSLGLYDATLAFCVAMGVAALGTVASVLRGGNGI